MKKPILDLINNRTVFFDGAMGTELLERGLVLGDSAERFSPYFSEIITSIHKAYFDAGADAVHTNTYGATSIALGKKLAGKIELINLRQVELAREVCPKNCFIAGNIGPNAVLLERDGGDFTIEMLQEALAEQIKALVKGGVDLLSVETMYYLDEALATIKVAQEICDLPIFVSMTYDKTSDGYQTPIDNKGVQECVTELEKAGADVIGCGCTLGSFEMNALAKEIKNNSKKPVIIQPTAGAPLSVAGKNLYPINPERFAKDMFDLYTMGIDVLGGCCGTTPLHIEKMIELIKKNKKK
ncbi:MAG: homocysteine S-methyltransferase family protein [Candidatus Heimdallarchaeota archaeon]|nr:homocysteine S-methyltransferase family protein [Candidatus Heimdallarchaeota archaeon]